MNQKIQVLKRYVRTALDLAGEAAYVICSTPVKIMEGWRSVKLSTDVLLQLREDLLAIQSHPHTWGYPRLNLLNLRFAAQASNRLNLKILYRELLAFDSIFNAVQHQYVNGTDALKVAIRVYQDVPGFLSWIDAQTDNFYAWHR